MTSKSKDTRYWHKDITDENVLYHIEQLYGQDRTLFIRQAENYDLSQEMQKLLVQKVLILETKQANSSRNSLIYILLTCLCISLNTYTIFKSNNLIKQSNKEQQTSVVDEGGQSDVK